MTRDQYCEHLRTVLCYDSIIDVLSIAERYWLHREIIINTSKDEGVAISRDTTGRILAISQRIVERNLKRPELRYNCARELEVYNSDRETWEKFVPEKFINQ